MTSEALYLCLDQGGHASRAILHDRRGRSLLQTFVPISTHRSSDDHVEHDADEVADSLRTAAIDVVSQIGRDFPMGAAIAAAGLATQRSSIVCWDRLTGTALSPVISWQDRRNAALVQSLAAHAVRIREVTGLVLSPHYGASKLRWCLDNLPAVQQAAANGTLAAGPLSSFLLFRLLAERPLVVDPANASRTQLWNVDTGQWAPELLQWFGVPAASLPQPVGSRHAFGRLELPSASIPLTVCTGDQSAVPFAFGSLRADAAYINLGTGAFIQRPLLGSSDPRTLESRLLCSVLWSDGQTRVASLEGTVNGAGSALEWFARREGIDLDTMWAQLSSASELQRRPLFLNGISGLGSPFWIADFPTRFEGSGDVQEKFLAVVESILFLLRVNLDGMQRAVRLRHLIVTGGLSAADLVCQGLADLTNLPVIRHEEREATARGLAYLLAGQPHDWMVPVQRVFEPRFNAGLRERFFGWLKSMKQVVRSIPQCPTSGLNYNPAS